MRDGTEISLIAYVPEFRELFQFLHYSASLYSRVGYSGPIHVSWEISHPTLGELRRLHLPQEAGHAPLPLVAPGGTLRIAVEDSAMTLINEPKEILRQLGDGLFRCFGLWEVPKRYIDSV
ncbi:unnamed protein product [marine sediment metagenome]|uniref:Uncharacterized protein n=1 Tax=marine sediment metagenome TaxID=412755 RepID=X0SZS5_9ZZZZ